MTNSIAINTVCKINYNNNCGNCPLRIDGKCCPENTENLEAIAIDYINNRTVFIYKSKDNPEAFYVTNGKINNKGNYLLGRLGMKDDFNILVDELTLINNYVEVSL